MPPMAKAATVTTAAVTIRQSILGPGIERCGATALGVVAVG
jgi:hypothetical protein